MVKKYCSWAGITAFLLCFGIGSAAQEDSSAFTNRFAISAGAGYQLMQMNSFNNYMKSTFYQGREDEYNPITGTVFFYVSQKYTPVAGSRFYVVLEFSKASFTREVNDLPRDTFAPKKDYTFVPQLWRMSLGAGYRHKVNNKAYLFLEASPVLNMTKADVFTIQRILVPSREYKEKDEWTSIGLGALGKVGIEYYFAKSLSASANIGFLFAPNPELKDVNDSPIIIRGQPNSTLNLNFSGFNAVINLNYYLF